MPHDPAADASAPHPVIARRKRVTEPRASVASWLPASLHDALIEVAKMQEQSVSATVRNIVRRDPSVSRCLRIR